MVAVKGVPLPEIRRTVDQETIFEVGTNDDQEPNFEVECHIPDTIHNLQASQKNAVTSHRHQKYAADAQVTEIFRIALNLAGQRSSHIELLTDHLQETIREMNRDIASGNEHHKRSSEYAFPETGRSNKRVEKRKKKCWRVLRHPLILYAPSCTIPTQRHGITIFEDIKVFQLLQFRYNLLEFFPRIWFVGSFVGANYVVINCKFWVSTRVDGVNNLRLGPSDLR
ncbi:hypothetical protein IV203_019815 [Nitzschia inconspicua]|uniref:Uncharacterized protein n=1 Tax=Nitzschia inconspicua TaxID=303405 RepID=A0A9K3K6K6_9STRA|nr:hypothetical protein IV203_020384 [Nitzschia inconspicua]KAG7371245.1 hypothetical protein IV203_019815 [Nitzschia inconspicua]